NDSKNTTISRENSSRCNHYPKRKTGRSEASSFGATCIRKRNDSNLYENNELDIQTLPTVPVFVRKMLLNWVGKAMSHKDHTFQTEHGHKVKMVLDDTKKMILRAEDGDMTMPSIIFHFQK